MKITRTVDGKEMTFELTDAEVLEAYNEKDWQYKYEIVEDRVRMFGSNGVVSKKLAEELLKNEDFLSEAADRYGDAMSIAISEEVDLDDILRGMLREIADCGKIGSSYCDTFVTNDEAGEPERDWP